MSVFPHAFARRLEGRLAKPMFVLAMLSLLLLAGLIHRARIDSDAEIGTLTTEDLLANLDFFTLPWLAESVAESFEVRLIVWGMLLLWPVFFIEGLLRFLLRPSADWTGKNLCGSLAPVLFPPLRLVVRSVTRPNEVWLPWLGWKVVDFDLRMDLERFFSAPMLVLALLILPVLAVEYYWADQVVAWPALRLGLDIGISLIWIAFVMDFVIGISVASSRLRYVFSHWLDLAIVLLPMVEFMPALRLFRLARLAKYYRLYGLAGKGWRAFVILEVIQHLLSRSEKAKLGRLRNRLEGKLAQAEELKREIDYYRRRIEAAERRAMAQETQVPPPAEPAEKAASEQELTAG